MVKQGKLNKRRHNLENVSIYGIGIIEKAAWCQFHQHLRARFSYKFWCQSQNVARKAAKKDIPTKKKRAKKR